MSENITPIIDSRRLSLKEEGIGVTCLLMMIKGRKERSDETGPIPDPRRFALNFDVLGIMGSDMKRRNYIEAIKDRLNELGIDTSNRTLNCARSCFSDRKFSDDSKVVPFRVK